MDNPTEIVLIDGPLKGQAHPEMDADFLLVETDDGTLQMYGWGKLLGEGPTDDGGRRAFYHAGNTVGPPQSLPPKE